MRQRWMVGLAASLFATAVGAQQPTAEDSSSHAPTSGEMSEVNSYSQNVGREVLKEELGLDLNKLRFEFNPQTLRLEQAGEYQRAAPSNDYDVTGRRSTGKAAVTSSTLPEAARPQTRFSLAVDQSGDLMKLRQDVRDIPFGLRLEGEVPLLSRLTSLKTKVWVPFEWDEEFKAEAKVPLYKLKLGATDRFLTGLGLQDQVDLRSDYTNRLGVNQVEAGLGAKWRTPFTGLLDLDYDYSQRFGQGLDETIHWIKLRKDF